MSVERPASRLLERHARYYLAQAEQAAECYANALTLARDIGYPEVEARAARGLRLGVPSVA
ncbi:MAG: hypothetical protein U0822_23790 [Anaerolineae bacterium]